MASSRRFFSPSLTALVMVAPTSAGTACVLDLYQRRTGSWKRRVSWVFVIITLVFVYTTVDNEKRCLRNGGGRM